MEKLKRAVALLCVLLCITGSFSTAMGETEKFVAPELSDDANPYDSAHPENLEAEQLYGLSAILIEEQGGEIIFEKNVDARMYPASTTKIMTIFLGCVFGDMNELVTVDEDLMRDIDLDDNPTMLGLEVGETILFEDLLFATFLRSGNDGTNVIAKAISGDINTFIELMNETAGLAGCENTNFANTHGLHNENHYTTARDMAVIARQAMQNNKFREIVNTTTYNLPKSNMSRAKTLTTNNNFINAGEKNDSYYTYGTGIKTGFTTPAGYCYVGSATKDGISLISVVFYSGDKRRFMDTKKLMEYGFSQFVSITPVDLYDRNPITIETSKYSTEDTNVGRLLLNLEVQDKAADASLIVTLDQVEALARNLRQIVVIEYTREFNAPITQGEVMGTLTYFPEGRDPVVYDLVASRSIAKRENAPKTIEEIEAEVYADPNPFPPIDLELVLTALAPIIGLWILIHFLRKIRIRRRVRDSKIPKPSNRYFR